MTEVERSAIVVHHYPQSPAAEKLRVALGIKRAAWRSVEIPRLPPKPDLVALTGGYRMTPVMQIGAHIYCDSHCVLRALEAHQPDPTLFPAAAVGLAWGVSRWTDDALFRLAIAIVFGALGDELPEAFARDRGRLYFGPRFEVGALVADLPHNLAQMNAQLGWIEERLAAGTEYLFGDAPGLPDALCYHIVWFLRGRYAGGPEMLAGFPRLVAWETRVRGLGHGDSQPLDAGAAIELARRSEIGPPGIVAAGDPQRLRIGQQVAVTSDADDGTGAVEGALFAADRDHIALLREDPRAGEVVVHFPRVGYRVR